MINLTGLHLLVTYRCNYSCDHCFVWSSPRASSKSLSLNEIDDILRQGVQLGTVRTIYFEGGEPFLHRDTLLQAVAHASELGFQAGIVTNGYWAYSRDAACETLIPFVEAGLDSLAVSADALHGDERAQRSAENAIAAVEELGLSLLVLRTEPPPAGAAYPPDTQGKVMFRGRAADLLADSAPHRSWREFDACPHENLSSPGRVHVDPFGYVHLCQGIVLGNLFDHPLTELLAAYDSAQHPIVGPILENGPAGLVEAYGLPPRAGYADACHLCYSARIQLHPRFPAFLAPAEMYGGSSAPDPIFAQETSKGGCRA